MQWLLRLLFLLWLLLAGPISVLIFGHLDLNAEWSTHSRRSAHLTPNPKAFKDAIVQIYAAPRKGWHGAFSIHTWLAMKRSHAANYKVYEVTGPRYPGVTVGDEESPDRYWFGQRPKLLRDLRGGSAIDQLINKIETTIARYPYLNKYRSWPGPNSNTFTAFLAREIPELALHLPPTAIGKDFLVQGIHSTPSKTGIQFSLYGVLGITAALKEGVELNILTLNIGIDPTGPALRLPGIGEVGLYP